MKKSITVSIVAYHNFVDIENLIESIFKFTSKEILLEIYIIDNGNTPMEFEKISKKFPDIYYINLIKNVGFGKGHNKILESLTTDYLAIVNPDILLKEDSFLSIIKFLSDKNNTVVIPKIEDLEGNLQKVYRRNLTIYDFVVRIFLKNILFFKKRYDYHTYQDKNFDDSFQVEFAQGSFLVMDSELFKKVGGFDEKFFMYVEDADLCKRINEIGRVLYYPKTTVVHKWEKGSHKNLKLLKYHISSIIVYFKKWGIRMF